MICPKCEYEYTEAVKSCPDCGSNLVTAEDFEGNLVHHSDWLVACNCGDNIEAEMMKTNLESAGIESLILSQSDRSFPLEGNMSIVKVLIKKTDAEEASAIINDILNDSSPDEN
jgi:predicted amidophosphoribosyltransferase